MKRTLCLLALFFTAFYIIHAQSIEISAGGGINVLSTTENHYRVSEFKNGSTYTLGVSLDGLIVDTLPPLKFTLGIENFRGEYYVSNFSPGGG